MEGAGFFFNSNLTQWHPQYNQLKEYKKDHEQLKDNYSYNPKFWRWTVKECTDYTMNVIGMNKAELLEETCFVFDKTKQDWDKYYTEVKRGYTVNGPLKECYELMN